MKPAAAKVDTNKNRRSVRQACNNATRTQLPNVVTKVATSGNRKNKRQANKIELKSENPVFDKALNSISPFLDDNLSQDTKFMAQIRTVDDESMVGQIFETTTEIKRGDSTTWGTSIKRQYAPGLRKVEDMTSIECNDPPEHPGTTVSRYPEEAYTSIYHRRMKIEWVERTSWDDCKNPIKPHKRVKQSTESSTGDVTMDNTLKTKQYQKDASLFKTGFGGRISLSDIAPKYSYSFVVPGHVTFCMLANFKSKEVIDLHRARMTRIATAKTVLYYQLHWRKGFKNTKTVNRTWQENDLIDNTGCYTIEVYLKNIGTAIKEATGNKTEYTTLCSLLETEKAVHQAGHIDEETCERVPAEYHPWILHQPLCAEGRSLQIWIMNEEGNLAPQLLHIPFGSACVLRGNVYHGGCYGNSGNIGFHAQLNPRPAEGKYLLVLKDKNECLRETDIPADEVNHAARTMEQVKFTQKYLRNMKKVYPSDTFWVQQPEENANWPVERLTLSSS